MRGIFSKTDVALRENKFFSAEMELAFDEAQRSFGFDGEVATHNVEVAGEFSLKSAPGKIDGLSGAEIDIVIKGVGGLEREDGTF